MEQLEKAIMDYRRALDYLVAETRHALKEDGLAENDIIWCNAKVALESAGGIHALAFMCGIMIVELANHANASPPSPYDPPGPGSVVLP